MKAAALFKPLSQGRVQCLVCLRRCVIEPGGDGYCHTRVNRGGKLYSEIYGMVSTLTVAPCELKPLFHFFPGQTMLSLGSLGCNFRCPGCQNAEIAHARPGQNPTRHMEPREVVELAREYNCIGVSFTYNEPVIWLEYTRDVFKIARALGLATNYVTNGSLTPEALEYIGPWLDAYRVDIKGFSRRAYQRIAHLGEFPSILETTRLARHHYRLWVEVVTNIIPGYNDDEVELSGLARWISEELGPDTPWHITRFFPQHRLSRLDPTPYETLSRARELGQAAGLRFVYLGNLPGDPAENTYCPGCGRTVIERRGYRVLSIRVHDSRCDHCGAPIPIRDRV